MSAGTAPHVGPKAPDVHNLRAVLGERGFRRLLWVRLLGQLSDGFFQAGLAGSVLFNPQDEASPTAIAAGFAVLLLPYSLIGPYLGVFLDRWSRRSIIYVANLLRAVLVVPAALLIYQGEGNTPAFLVLALLIIGLGRFFLAGLSAATPHVVDDHRLVTANAVQGTIGSIVYSVGLVGAAVLVKTALDTDIHGYATVAVLATIGYTASAVVGRRSFDDRGLGPDAASHASDPIITAIRTVGRETRAGLRHLSEKRGAAFAVLAQSVHRWLYGILALAVLLLYRGEFNTGDDVTGAFGGIGRAFAAAGVGLLLAAFVTPPIARRIGGWRWVTAQLALVAVVVVVCGLPFTPTLLLVAVFAMSFASQGIKIVVDTSLQHECADEYRGRVFSVNDTMFNICMVGGMTAAALTLPPGGHSPAALVVVSVGYGILAVTYALLAGGWARRAGDDIADPDGPGH